MRISIEMMREHCSTGKTSRTMAMASTGRSPGTNDLEVANATIADVV
jgi:hypothetical protein